MTYDYSLEKILRNDCTQQYDLNNMKGCLRPRYCQHALTKDGYDNICGLTVDKDKLNELLYNGYNYINKTR